MSLPSLDGFIDTLAGEGWREAVDDMRYVAALKEAVVQAKKQGKNTEAAEQLLSIDYIPHDLQEYRLEMAREIEFLLSEYFPVDTIGYELVSEKVISATQSEYQYRVRVVNTDVNEVECRTIEPAWVPDNMMILYSKVFFNSITGGQQALSDDTFIVIVDHNLPGDVNEIIWQISNEHESNFSIDDRINIADLKSIAEAWLTTDIDMIEDLYKDGQIDFKDMSIFAQRWYEQLAFVASITNPVDRSEFTGPPSPVTIDAQVWKANGSVTEVELFVNGIFAGEDINDANGWAINWQPAVSGDYSLRVMAIDEDGTKVQSIPVDIAWDIMAPEVTITSPNDNDEFDTNSTITVEADASDINGSVVQVEFFANGIAIGSDSDGGDGWSISWGPGVLSGDYSLTARAVDNQGAETVSAPVNIIVNLSVPR